MKYDFEGWATKNDIRCSDGVTIRRDAFRGCDGEVVPLVWNHQHNSPSDVLGHALLTNRREGVWAQCSFNNTEDGQKAKELVRHGDIRAMSIWANQLRKSGNDVTHGMIRELSLVMAGANPGAKVQNVMQHSVDGEYYPVDDELLIYPGEINGNAYIAHLDESVEDYEETNDENYEEFDDYDNYEESNDDDYVEHSDDKTVQDVIDSMTPEQKKVMAYLIGEAIDKTEGGTDEMKHNAWDNDEMYGNGTDGEILSQSEMAAIISDAKTVGSLKQAVIAHGIDQIDWLFPEAKSLNNPPFFIKRPTEWVDKVMNGVKHVPFSRIKSLFADITEDDARAKGYIKGNYKKEEVFGLLKRSTEPTTVYKKQRLHRDDVQDITDFDVVSWIKAEMRMMLNEELARAYLIGDGRLNSSDDKINPLNIRPIAFDEDLFNIKVRVPVTASMSSEDKAKAFIPAVIKSRKNYRGSGSLTMYITEDLLTDMLLITDNTGRDIYDSIEKLKSKLRVSEIVTVPVMEDVKGPNGGDLAAILVNLKDYNVGADKGGAVNMFDDFDIDYNAQKYLIETRCSGALVIPYSAITVEFTTN